MNTPGMSPQTENKNKATSMSRVLKWAGLFLLAFYVSPLWLSLRTWGGTFDWGYFFFLAEVDRKSVVEFGQFPLWNPYYCGGAVHLANPQTFFLSPTFLFIWLFGTPIGIRLTLTAAIALAMDGTARFLRVLGVGALGAFIGGAGYAVSGAVAQHLGGGHVGWVGFCVFPYVLHSFHRACQGEHRHVLYGGLFLAWIFGHFGGYTYPYCAIALGIYGALWAASGRQRVVVAASRVFGMLAFSIGIAAVRLIPILEFMQRHPRIRQDTDVLSPLEFFEIYFVRHRERMFGRHMYVWPEYGNYLGLGGLLLLVFGVVTVVRRRREFLPLLYATVIFLVFQIGNIPGFPWWLLKHLPVLRFMRAPCRFTILAGFFACALIGVGAERVTRSWKRRHDCQYEGPTPSRWKSWLGYLSLALVFGFVIDVAAFNREQWFQTLTTPQPNDPPAATFRQVRGDRHRMYAYPRTNQGTLDCFEEAPLDISPRLAGSLPADEFPADPSAGSVRRVSWSPNRIQVEANFTRPGRVVVNQNFHGSWRVSGGSLVSAGGLLAADVPAGRSIVTFRFLPGSFLIGLAITVATLAYGVWLWRRWAGNKAPAAR